MSRLKSLPPRLGGLGSKVKAAPKVALGFYQSPEWRELIRDIKRERGAFCQDCGSGHRVAGDHEVELRDGGAPLDPDNVRLRCAACHNRKTARAKAARASGEAG